MKPELFGLSPEAHPNLTQPTGHRHPSWICHSGHTEGQLLVLPSFLSIVHAPLYVRCSVSLMPPVLQAQAQCPLLLEAVPDPMQPDTPFPCSLPT